MRQDKNMYCHHLKSKTDMYNVYLKLVENATTLVNISQIYYLYIEYTNNINSILNI